jgi:hypothetical protein
LTLSTFLFSDLFGSTNSIGQNKVAGLMDIWCNASLVYLDKTDIFHRSRLLSFNLQFITRWGKVNHKNTYVKENIEKRKTEKASKSRNG